jgi:ATP-dependent DNA ligase
MRYLPLLAGECLLTLKGRDVMGEPLLKRRELLEKHVFPKMSEPIRYSPLLECEPQGSDPVRSSR